MPRFLPLITGTVFLFLTIVYCQSWNDTDSIENASEIIPVKPFVYYGRYHQRRFYRASSDKDSSSNSNTAATILSILPLDRLGAIIGQIMATGLREMLNPNLGKKLSMSLKIKFHHYSHPSLLISTILYEFQCDHRRIRRYQGMSILRTN